MAALLIKVCFPFLVMETLIGMVANGSIVLINFVDWIRRRKLSPTDAILVCLGLSRLLLQPVVILEVTLFILQNSTLKKLFGSIDGILIFANAVNLWFTAWLSVFYLAKIAVFSHPVFLQIKRRFPSLVPWMLLVSVAVSAVEAIIVTTSWNNDLTTCSPFKLFSSNRTYVERNVPHICRHIIAVIAAFDFIPLGVFLSSSVFLISSLWKHMRSVQCNGMGSKDLNTQAHWRAIKTLASFAVLYLISFAALTSQTILAVNNEYTWTIVVFIVSAVYPTGHAIILILINPKLKQAWVRITCYFTCRLNKAPS